LLILVLAVIIFGPEDMVKYSRAAGRWLYKVSKSDLWKSVAGTTREIQEFPKQIMKEAQIEETLKEFNAMNKPPQAPEPEPEHPMLPHKDPDSSMAFSDPPEKDPPSGEG
jgi:Sec-independent protein translocase protein TatA